MSSKEKRKNRIEKQTDYRRQSRRRKTTYQLLKPETFLLFIVANRRRIETQQSSVDPCQIKQQEVKEKKISPRPSLFEKKDEGLKT